MTVIGSVSGWQYLDKPIWKSNNSYPGTYIFWFVFISVWSQNYLFGFFNIFLQLEIQVEQLYLINVAYKTINFVNWYDNMAQARWMPL